MIVLQLLVLEMGLIMEMDVVINLCSVVDYSFS